jgi:transposase
LSDRFCDRVRLLANHNTARRTHAQTCFSLRATPVLPREHRELLLNWFKAKKEISCGVVEGLNTNVKLALRKARGFKSYEIAETALYHELGRLPEPELAHRFC